MNLKIKVVILASVILVLTGCANKGGYVQYHPGAALHPSQKSIIQGKNSYRNGSLANEMIRIIGIDGDTIPREWGIAEGANTISLLPGYYHVKFLYVHSVELIDYYSYETIPVMLQPNCTYRVLTSWSSIDKGMVYDLSGKPSTDSGNLDCNNPIQYHETSEYRH